MRDIGHAGPDTNISRCLRTGMEYAARAEGSNSPEERAELFIEAETSYWLALIHTMTARWRCQPALRSLSNNQPKKK